MCQVRSLSENVEIVRQLDLVRARFLVVGGAAVAVHGCRAPHEVDDLDLLIEPTLENAELVVGVLPAGGAQALFEPIALTRPLQHIRIRGLQGRLDILTPGPGIRFRDLLERSIPAVHGQVPVRVIAVDDLISMKEVAVARDPTNRDKHQRDLDCLRAKAMDDSPS